MANNDADAWKASAMALGEMRRGLADAWRASAMAVGEMRRGITFNTETTGKAPSFSTDVFAPAASVRWPAFPRPASVRPVRRVG